MRCVCPRLQAGVGRSPARYRWFCIFLPLFFLSFPPATPAGAQRGCWDVATVGAGPLSPRRLPSASVGDAGRGLGVSEELPLGWEAAGSSHGDLRWEPQRQEEGTSWLLFRRTLWLCGVRRPMSHTHGPMAAWEAPWQPASLQACCCGDHCPWRGGADAGSRGLRLRAAKQVSRRKRALSSHGRG